MANKTLSVHVNGINGKRDVRTLKRGLDALPGVTSVSATETGLLQVDFDPTGVDEGRILTQMEQLGFYLNV